MAPMAKNCEECQNEDDLWLCTRCDEYYCSAHWSARRKHNEISSVNLHEKVRPDVKERLDDCMMSDESDEAQLVRHRDDEPSTWFAFDRDEHGNPFLAEYERFSALMMETANESGSPRYPALVSFIGQTGAGKSSLIRMLIGMSKARAVGTQLPVPGRQGSHRPTSADVHLYLDPDTALSERPVLYADCEGFEGGDIDPVAVNVGNKLVKYGAEKLSQPGPAARLRNAAYKAVSHGMKHYLNWAGQSDEAARRGYAVKEMYPRIFYAFSEVVVYVLNEARTLETVVEKLLEWAAVNSSTSINLPTKPYAIIALNKSGDQTTSENWSVSHATEALLAERGIDLKQNSAFKKYIARWSGYEHGSIHSMKDLLKCYYADVHVVRLPEYTRYGRMAEQREQLYNKITAGCERSRQRKAALDRLPDADQFALYLSLAFDHFAGPNGLKEPFDFISASLKVHPPPPTFAGNVLTLINMVAREYHSLKINLPKLFEALTPIIASYLMLECIRRERPGRPIDWFSASLSSGAEYMTRGTSSTESERAGSYRAMCEQAMTDYLLDHAPCEGTVSVVTWDLPKTLKIPPLPCDLMQRAHQSVGHATIYGQMRYGTLLRFSNDGEYRNRFVESEPQRKWTEQILAALNDIHKSHAAADEKMTRFSFAKKHRDALRSLFQAAPHGSTFRSNKVCMVCLFNPPEHSLECGHVLCTDCAQDYGQRLEPKSLSIPRCPLHWDTDSSISTPYAVVITTPPPHIGQRVLLLDGGGIRGIVELCVLEALQSRLSGIRLQQFFDIVVGTSTGGIIALAFGDNMWDIETCVQKFQELARDAFRLRVGQNTFYIKHVQQALKSKYKTGPIEAALRNAFTEDTKLFGLRRPPPNWTSRLNVAVTACSPSSDQAYVISNYNASNQGSASSPKYERFRPNDPADEMMVWQAARATSAAPGFFRPFPKQKQSTPFIQNPNQIASYDDSTIKQFIDGGLRHNNPVEIALEEASRLGAAKRSSPLPDIVLSLGTGEEYPYARNALKTVPAGLLSKLPGASNVKSLFTLAAYQIKLNLRTDSRWKEQKEARADLHDRMHRINPDLARDPPMMDAVDEVEPLRDYMRAIAKTNGAYKVQLDDITCRLVASSFYFERGSFTRHAQSSTWIANGTIQCRFQPFKEDFKGLGAFLQRCQKPATFVVRTAPFEGEEFRVDINVDKLLKYGDYEAPKVSLSMPKDEKETSIYLSLPGIHPRLSRHIISGFPRNLSRNDFGRR